MRGFERSLRPTVTNEGRFDQVQVEKVFTTVEDFNNDELVKRRARRLEFILETDTYCIQSVVGLSQVSVRYMVKDKSESVVLRKGVAETNLLIKKNSRAKMLLVMVVTLKVSIMDGAAKPHVKEKICLLDFP